MKKRNGSNQLITISIESATRDALRDLAAENKTTIYGLVDLLVKNGKDIFYKKM